MNATPLIAIAISFAVLGTGTRLAFSAPKDQQQPAPTGFAVVELFTSEGCSSCPSADAALADLVANSRGQPVYALAFHVDYWDGLGWPDAFADAAYTARQQRYGVTKKLEGVYTPQAIVNGDRQFVGSDRAKLSQAVADARATPASATISGTAKTTDGGVEIAIAGMKLDAGTIVNAALVEDGLTSKVTRGENAGRVLPHEHVVRAFDSTIADKEGRATVLLKVPASVKRDRATMILYAQRTSDLHVVAAAELKMPE